ncbi:PAS domain-containing protein [Hymenobacter sp.]|jgi:PAS domain S-box-containing protein|uniref:PAS domain-containing protein n=1 Tax=Hymenobacter sp. TaxID=1898978 RepID=UPI002ED839C4
MIDLPDFQLLFDALPTPCLALHPHDLTVVAANAASQAILGEALLLGRAAPEVFGDETDLAGWEAALAALQVSTAPYLLPVVLPHLPAHQAQPVHNWYLLLTPVRSAPEAPVRYLLCQLQKQTPAPATIPAQSLSAEPRLPQEQFRFLADFIPQLVWIANAAGRYEYFNARWMAYTGYTIADASIPGLWLAMTHPDDQERVRKRWRHSLTTGEAYEAEFRFRGCDGVFRWFFSQALPQRDAAGTIVRWFGTSTDIDHQKQTRQLLEEKDQQLQQILSQVPAYIATLTGPNHVYRYVNERGQQLFNGQVRLGMPAAQVAPELVNQGFIALIDEVYRTGEPYVLHEVPFQSSAPLKGQQEWFFNGVFQPLLDENNRTQGILVFGIDVTEQVRAKQRTTKLLEEVRHQDREFRQALEALPQMAWLSRANGLVFYYNQRWFDYTGATLDELRNSGWHHYLHPDDLAATVQGWQVAIEQGSTFETEHRWRSHDGQYRWFLARGVPIRRFDGSILLWVGTNTDIDDQRRIRERLEEKDRQLLEIFSQAPAAIATLEGPEHRLTFFNASYTTFVGGRTQVGQPLAALLPELEEQGMVALLDSVYTTGQPQQGFETLVAMQDPAGTALRQYHVTFTFQPLYDELQQVRGILAFILDVTEQVRNRQKSEALQAQISRRNEQVRLMTESLPVITFINDAAGQALYASPQWYAFTGHDPAAPITDIWHHFVHPDDLPAVYPLYEAALAAGHSWSYEFRLRRHDGQYRWQLSRGVPEFNTAGRVVCWYGTDTDIHEERELRELLQTQNAELLRTNASLDNFVYTTSHDLKQPINNMAGIFQELTRTAHFRDPDAVKLVGMFERALQQINGTIGDLSELVQKQRQYLPTEPIELATLTTEVLASIQDQLTASGAQVSTNFEVVPVVEFVRSNLQSVLYNLVSNALKYAAPGRVPCIHLSSRLHDGQLLLVVQDNGIGIDLVRFRGQLFQLFRRFHDHVEGSGMGLYLVNRIVQQAGGRVEVESTVNEGATFRVYLPMQRV